jgi:DNA-binding transcriptional MerR regulator
VSAYSIQELAREFNITPRAIRFYEDKGLINPKRQGVTRVFSERDRIRLGLTLRSKRLGFSLEEINEIIDMYDPAGPDDPAQLMRLWQKVHEHRKILVSKINDIKDILIVIDQVEQRVLQTLMDRQTARADAQAEFDI